MPLQTTGPVCLRISFRLKSRLAHFLFLCSFDNCLANRFRQYQRHIKVSAATCTLSPFPSTHLRQCHLSLSVGGKGSKAPAPAVAIQVPDLIVDVRKVKSAESAPAATMC